MLTQYPRFLRNYDFYAKVHQIIKGLMSAENEYIVESIAHLAKNLKIKIVAEGIETEQQLTLLKAMDYQLGQGFYFSKSIRREKILGYVLSR